VATMRIERLPEGERASEETDCIHLEARDGLFYLTGSALKRDDAREQPESIAIVSGEPYGSEQAAEDAGIAWASGHGVEHLFISRS